MELSPAIPQGQTGQGQLGKSVCARVLVVPLGHAGLDVEHHVGLHVVERSDFAEVRPLMEGLRRHGSHRELTRNQLMSGTWQLNQSLIPPTHHSLPTDGAEKAAQIIIGLAES